MSLTIADLCLLVTDDSITQRQYVTDLCKELDVKEIYEAENGVTALNILQEREIDVALIDLEMPIMDGIELIRAIAIKKLCRNVIILSAKDPF